MTLSAKEFRNMAARNHHEIQVIEEPQGFGRPGKLHDFRSVRKEVARLYRRVCQGHITPEEASKMTFILDRLGKLMEGEMLETRIKAIEGGLADGDED